MEQDTSYDQLPYADYVFPHTHPEHLGSVARWLGHPAPDFARCRVLELGCASGGNLIPMAVDLPGGAFLGVDLSPRQVDAGAEMVRRLGITNVSLRAGSILDVPADDALGQFDYVICHGVYSWVPAPVREAILAACARRLTPRGVAYVSYNTLPGWSVPRVVRDYLLFHVPRTGEPAARVAAARQALELFARVQGAAGTPVGACLRAEAEALAGVDDSYLFHEYLEEVNEAFYVSDFARAAGAHGLHHLGDADLATHVGPRAQGAIGADALALEQSADFLRNRRFRASLLVRAAGGESERARWAPSPTELGTFWFSTRAELAENGTAEDLRNDRPLWFEQDGRRFQLRDAAGKTVLVSLAERVRRPVAWAELAATAGAVGAGAMGARVIELVFAGRVEVHGSAARYAERAGERPVASPLAREQARRGAVVTTLRHQQVDVGDAERALIPLLDGSRTRAELGAGCDAVLEWLALNAVLR